MATPAMCLSSKGCHSAGVVLICRDPVQLGPEVSFHLLHQIAGGLARVGQVPAVLGWDDEAELVPSWWPRSRKAWPYSTSRSAE